MSEATQRSPSCWECGIPFTDQSAIEEGDGVGLYHSKCLGDLRKCKRCGADRFNEYCDFCACRQHGNCGERGRSDDVTDCICDG